MRDDEDGGEGTMSTLVWWEGRVGVEIVGGSPAADGMEFLEERFGFDLLVTHISWEGE